MQSALTKEGTGIETGNLVGGKGALDNINMEGTGRTWRESFDGFDVEDGVDTSADNGRSQGTEGVGGLTKFGGSHMNHSVKYCISRLSGFFWKT